MSILDARTRQEAFYLLESLLQDRQWRPARYYASGRNKVVLFSGPYHADGRSYS